MDIVNFAAGRLMSPFASSTGEYPCKAPCHKVPVLPGTRMGDVVLVFTFCRLTEYDILPGFGTCC